MEATSAAEAMASVTATIRAWKIIKFPTKGSVPRPEGCQGAGDGGVGETRPLLT